MCTINDLFRHIPLVHIKSWCNTLVGQSNLWPSQICILWWYSTFCLEYDVFLAVTFFSHGASKNLISSSSTSSVDEVESLYKASSIVFVLFFCITYCSLTDVFCTKKVDNGTRSYQISPYNSSPCPRNATSPSYILLTNKNNITRNAWPGTSPPSS